VSVRPLIDAHDYYIIVYISDHVYAAVHDLFENEVMLFYRLQILSVAYRSEIVDTG